LVVIALEARQQPYSLEHAMHTNSKTAFARGDRLTPEDLSLGEEARNVWLTITENRQLRDRLMKTPLRHKVYRFRRENDRSDPLELLSCFIVIAAACGYPESTVRLLLTHIESVIARCYTGNAHRTIDELDLEEGRLESEENELGLRRRIAGETVSAEHLEHEATLNELEANVQLERAKLLRRMARTEPRVLPFPRTFARPMGVVS
jgi:hypothetical protein